MSREQSVKRRAIATGLKPFLGEAELQQAIQHWQIHHADNPRTSLQKFVAEIVGDGSLRTQRSSILLNLVKAMNLPESALLPDPLAVQSPAARGSSSRITALAFNQLMSSLMTAMRTSAQQSIRLDLLASLDNPNLPEPVVESLHQWLNRGRPLLLETGSPIVLRALVNRTYVVMCERLGPVEADKLLSDVVDHCQQARPDLSSALSELL